MISHVRVVDLTDAELKRCKELSFGDEGYMCEDLDAILETERCWRYRYSKAILLRAGNKIVGWALLQPVPRSSRWVAQFFVDPIHRRKGYGTILLQETNYLCKIPYVYTDSDNRQFFEHSPQLYRDWEYT